MMDVDDKAIQSADAPFLLLDLSLSLYLSIVRFFLPFPEPIQLHQQYDMLND